MSALERAWLGWSRLWLGRADALRLAWFRVAWGLAALLVAFGDEARAEDYAPNRFHLPLFGLAEPIWPETHQWLRYVALLGAALAVSGVLARLGIAALSAIYAYLLSVDVLLFRNHVYLLCLLGAVLACSPCDQRLSLWRPRAAPVRSLPVWPEQLLKAQVLTVYFWAALAKLNSSFLSGAVLASDLASALPDSLLGMVLQGPLIGAYPWVLACLGHTGAMRTLSWSVALGESFVVVGLWVPRLRRAAMAVGLTLHESVALSMNVFAFGLLMVGSYVLFWPRSVEAGARRKRVAREVETGAEGVPG